MESIEGIQYQAALIIVHGKALTGKIIRRVRIGKSI